MNTKAEQTARRERIQAFLAARQIASVNAWAVRAEVSEGTLRAYMEGRTNELAGRTLRKLAAAAGVTAADLIRVIDPRLKLARDLDTQVKSDDPRWELGETPPGYELVRTLDVRAGLGGGGAGEEDFVGEPVLMPSSLIQGELRGTADDFLLLDVEGMSMYPDLHSGDRVLIDRRKTNPSQPGVFALFDGYGIVCKLIERVVRSDPPAVRVISRDQAITPYTATLDEARIIGRAVWFARRM